MMRSTISRSVVNFYSHAFVRSQTQLSLSRSNGFQQMTRSYSAGHSHEEHHDDDHHHDDSTPAQELFTKKTYTILRAVAAFVAIVMPIGDRSSVW
ncbi:hypothetical protein V1522DRAFT_429563 [Lipomyces starkeyi]